MSSDLRCMALTGWQTGISAAGTPSLPRQQAHAQQDSQQGSQQGSQQATIMTASSDATMALIQFDLRTRRSVCPSEHARTCTFL